MSSLTKDTAASLLASLMLLEIYCLRHVATLYSNHLHVCSAFLLTFDYLFALFCFCMLSINSRRRLRSSSSSALVAPRTSRATIGDRAFPAAAASIWNSLPESVRSSPSLPVLRSRLKTELFARSYSSPA